jgi:hypothetical protein
MRWGLAFALVLVAGQANAANVWRHNGSVLRLEADGPVRKFYYMTPSPGLPASAGALLFEGTKSGNTYSGTAYVFSTKCGSVGYPVTGTVSEDQRSIAMTGDAPQRDANCKTKGTRSDTLVFTFDHRDEDNNPPAGRTPVPSTPSVASEELPHPPRWTGSMPPPGSVCPNQDPFSRNLKFVVICKHAEIGDVTNVKPFAPGTWEDKQDPDWAFLKQYWQTGNMFYFPREACGFGDDEFAARSDAKLTAASYAFQTRSAWDELLKRGKFRPALAFQRRGEAVECRRLSPTAGAVTSEAIPPNGNDEAERRREAEAERRRQAEAEARAKAEAEERRRAAEAARRTLVVEVRSLDSYIVHLRFHSQDRNVGWPESGRVWILDDSQFHTYRLACSPGEKICYGAGRSGNYNRYWGTAVSGNEGCKGCCMTCGGSYRYTLNGGDETASSSSDGVRLGDVIELGTAIIGLGAAVAGSTGSGSGGGSTPRYSPAPRQRGSDITGTHR